MGYQEIPLPSLASLAGKHPTPIQSSLPSSLPPLRPLLLLLHYIHILSSLRPWYSQYIGSCLEDPLVCKRRVRVVALSGYDWLGVEWILQLMEMDDTPVAVVDNELLVVIVVWAL